MKQLFITRSKITGNRIHRVSAVDHIVFHGDNKSSFKLVFGGHKNSGSALIAKAPILIVIRVKNTSNTKKYVFRK